MLDSEPQTTAMMETGDPSNGAGMGQRLVNGGEHGCLRLLVNRVTCRALEQLGASPSGGVIYGAQNFSQGALYRPLASAYCALCM